MLGVDPGTRKVGFAVLDASGRVLSKGIEGIEGFAGRLADLAGLGPISAVALGRGTNSEALRERLEAVGAPVHLVDERETTLRARQLYFSDHPPRGWRRLIPIGMQLPPEPIDDYAAVLIARKFLQDGGFEAHPA
ncbi:MAG: pre-16S rRNA-processing nuclease YqgF [Vulcanimicrobiaceae bacterium]